MRRLLAENVLDMNFRGRVAVVTGAASGMGRALSWELGRAGASLALIDQDEVGLQRLHEEGMRRAVVGCDTDPACALYESIGFRRSWTITSYAR